MWDWAGDEREAREWTDEEGEEGVGVLRRRNWEEGEEGTTLG